MAKRYRWECPTCGRAYAVPSVAGLTICPRCQADNEPPIISVNSKHSSVYWTKIGLPQLSPEAKTLITRILITIGLGALAAIGLGSILVLVFSEGKSVSDRLVNLLGFYLIVGVIIIYCVIAILSAVIFLLIYFLPSIIAYRRAHRNFVPILILNFAFAWTFAAWIGLMVWATVSTVKIETERTI